MKNLVKFFLFVSIGLSPSFASGANFIEKHYVTHNGEGKRNGESPSNSWSINNFHDQNIWSSSKAVDGLIGPGDVVYFGGTINQRVIINNGGNIDGSITIDGYEQDNCDPLRTECTSSAILKQGISIGNRQNGPDYLTIQDFRITNNADKVPGIYIYGNQSGNDDQKNIDHSIVRRNYVFETNGTMLYWFGGRNSIIENNKCTNFGQNNTDVSQGINITKFNHSLIRGNEFGHNQSAYPSGCTSAEMVELHGCQDMLMEYNNIYGAPNQSGIRPKEGSGGNKRVVIRFNKIHNNLGGNPDIPFGESSGKGIHMNSLPDSVTEHIYIYGNYIYNNQKYGISDGNYTNNVKIWSNLLVNNGFHGFVTYGINSKNYLIYNNTFALNGWNDPNNSGRAGIVLTNGSSFSIKNNILWNNRPTGAGSKMHQIYTNRAIDALSNNTYFHRISDATVYYLGTIKMIDSLGNISGFHNNELVPFNGDKSDLFFTNPEGYDSAIGSEDDKYCLSPQSPVVDSGEDLSECYEINIGNNNPWFLERTGYNIISACLEDALDPYKTDWTTNPPTVKIVNQNQHGINWERGAYAYLGQPTLEPPKNVFIKQTN